MPRKQVVTVSGKTITITEKRVGEIEGLMSQLSDPFNETLKATTVEEVKAGLLGTLYDKLPALIAPDLTAEDMKNAYPSEIEDLIGAFIDVNFTGVKRVVGPLLNLARAGLLPK